MVNRPAGAKSCLAEMGDLGGGAASGIGMCFGLGTEHLNFHISKDSADFSGSSFEMKERFPKLCGHVSVGAMSSV